MLQENQNAELETLIQAELEQLQPYIASHGGRIEYVRLQGQFVYVALHGACQQCPLSFYTLTYGIERKLQENVDTRLRVKVVE